MLTKMFSPIVKRDAAPGVGNPSQLRLPPRKFFPEDASAPAVSVGTPTRRSAPSMRRSPTASLRIGVPPSQQDRVRAAPGSPKKAPSPQAHTAHHSGENARLQHENNNNGLPPQEPLRRGKLLNRSCLYCNSLFIGAFDAEGQFCSGASRIICPSRPPRPPFIKTPARTFDRYNPCTNTARSTA